MVNTMQMPMVKMMQMPHKVRRLAIPLTGLTPPLRG
jgi:hypothetical protein